MSSLSRSTTIAKSSSDSQLLNIAPLVSSGQIVHVHSQKLRSRTLPDKKSCAMLMLMVTTTILGTTKDYRKAFKTISMTSSSVSNELPRSKKVSHGSRNKFYISTNYSVRAIRESFSKFLRRRKFNIKYSKAPVYNIKKL